MRSTRLGMRGRSGRVVVRIHGRPRPRPASRSRTTERAVAPEMAEHLFEVFETTKTRGMGLGLPLTREIGLEACRPSGNGVPCSPGARASSSSCDPWTPKRIPARRRVQSSMTSRRSARLSPSCCRRLRSTPRRIGIGRKPTSRRRRSANPVCLILDNRLPGIQRTGAAQAHRGRGRRGRRHQMTGHGDVPTGGGGDEARRLPISWKNPLMPRPC